MEWVMTLFVCVSEQKWQFWSQSEQIWCFLRPDWPVQFLVKFLKLVKLSQSGRHCRFEIAAAISHIHPNRARCTSDASYACTALLQQLCPSTTIYRVSRWPIICIYRELTRQPDNLAIRITHNEISYAAFETWYQSWILSRCLPCER